MPRSGPDNGSQRRPSSGRSGLSLARASSSFEAASSASAVVRPATAAATGGSDRPVSAATRRTSGYVYQECESALAARHAARQIDLVVRPHTAPLKRPKSAAPTNCGSEGLGSGTWQRSPFAIEAPLLRAHDLLQTEASHRAYSAGGSRNRFPARAEFGATLVAWSLGPGSYDSARRPEKHTPSFVYGAAHDGPDPTGAGGHATSAQTERALADIRAKGHGGGAAGVSASQLEHIAPRAVRQHSIRGPLLSQTYASTHASHSREEQLKSALAAANAAPTVTRVHMHVADSAFSPSNGRGPHISAADVGYRARPEPPSGPSRADALRPDWSRLQVYVPPAVIGPRLAFGEEFMPQLDPETGEPMHSQARIRALQASGASDVKNFVQVNRRSQGARTRLQEAARLEQRNRALEAKLERVQAFQLEQQQQARQRYEAAVIDKDLGVRAERRARTQAAAQHEALLRSWLCFTALGATASVLHERLAEIQLVHLKKIAAKRIWRFYSRWKLTMKDKISRMTRNRRMRPAAAPPVAAPTSPADATTSRLSSLIAMSRANSIAGPVHLPPSMLHLLTGAQEQFTPRTAAQIKERGLHSLVAYRAQEEAAGVLSDFFAWALQDRFKRLKDAMLTFSRKARLIQRWWRRHLLAMQWRLWIQTLQFLAYRERTIKQDHTQRQGTVQGKQTSGAHRSAGASHHGSPSKGRSGRGSLEEESKQQHAGSDRRMGSPTRGTAAPSSSVAAATSVWWDGRNNRGSGHFAFDDDDGGDTGGGHVTFASSSLLAGGGAAGAAGSGSRASRNRALFRDPSAVGENQERSSSAKMAYRVLTQFAFEEDPSSSASGGGGLQGAALLAKRQMLKKLSVPQRMSGAVVLDKHSSLVQWNVMVWLSKDVFAERLRQARMRFRQWMRSMRIQGMRDELMQHSNTVRPMSQQQEREAAQTQTTSSAAASSPDASDDDADAKGTRQRSGTSSSHGRSRSPNRTRRSSPSPANSNFAFLARVRTPAFFRLLLTEGELGAICRGINLLLAHPDARWMRDGTVHSPHFILLRPESSAASGGRGGGGGGLTGSGSMASLHAADLSQLVPLFIGHKYAARRLHQVRIMSARVRDEEDAEAAERQRQEDDSKQNEIDAELVASLRGRTGAPLRPSNAAGASGRVVPPLLRASTLRLPGDGLASVGGSASSASGGHAFGADGGGSLRRSSLLGLSSHASASSKSPSRARVLSPAASALHSADSSRANSMLNRSHSSSTRPRRVGE